MCVGFWSLEHPDYALILCNNRDEFLARPTTDAHFHSFGKDTSGDGGTVLSGLDVTAGGTWLGMTRAGRIALLTNITEPTPHVNSSRGHLVSSFLLSESSHPLEDEVGKITPMDANYAGFNLLLLSPKSQEFETLSFDAAFVSNGGAGGLITIRPLSVEERQRGGMSNGIDGKGAQEWPKVRNGVELLSNILHSDITETALTESLFKLLTLRPPEPPRQRMELRNAIHVEPFQVPGSNPAAYYGTRLSTVILIRRDGRVLFVERDIWKLDKDGKPALSDPPTQREFRFHISGRAPA